MNQIEGKNYIGPNGIKQGYITLLSSEDYLIAVLCLAYSLQVVKSQYPLIVLTTDNLENDDKIIDILCSAPNIIHVTVSSLEYCDKIKQDWKGHSVLNTASKIQIFLLKDWYKLVYIDADTLIINNIDNLFEDYLDGSMIKYPDQRYGFSGLFIIEPWRHEEDNFYKFLLQTQECFDGDLIGKLWFFIRTSKSHQIPPSYLWDFRTSYHIPKDTKVIHYVGEYKPWLDNLGCYTSCEAMRVYQIVLKKVREIYDV